MIGRIGRDPQAGITLIETLIVLVLIGVGAGAALMVSGNNGRKVQDEAVALALAMSLGVDEALITGQPLALHWDASGYSFVQRPDDPEQTGMSPADWPAAAPRALGLRHDLPGSMVLSMADDAETAAVMLYPGAIGPTVSFEVSDAGTVWTVIFDGFTATPAAGEAP